MRSVIVLALMCSLGCSRIVMDTLPPRPRPGTPCTTSNGWAWWDTLQAVGGAIWSVAALMYIGQLNDGDEYDGIRNTLAISAGVSIVQSAVYGGSAAHGFRESKRCREFHGLE
jgi:hypothetical protein